jgi:hypothetical protein
LWAAFLAAFAAFADDPGAGTARFEQTKNCRAAGDGYYAGVWHFGEEIAEPEAAVATVAADSAKHDTTLVMDATPVGIGYSVRDKTSRAMLSVEGAAGTARVLAGWNGASYFTAPAYDRFRLGGAFTFSRWLKREGIGKGIGNLILTTHQSVAWKDW